MNGELHRRTVLVINGTRLESPESKGLLLRKLDEASDQEFVPLLLGYPSSPTLHRAHVRRASVDVIFDGDVLPDEDELV